MSPDRSRPGSREQDLASVEIDSAFAKTIGLSDGQKISILLHLDPIEAHTVNIEPLTPADWEIIELHATFLETNMLTQIRALPNPSFVSSSAAQGDLSHPLTLHLSPTSTANIRVTSLTPELPNTTPFAKIAREAEVIVAPKVRSKSGRSTRADSRSIASRRSGKSGVSGTRPGSSHKSPARSALYFRGVDRKIGRRWFDAEDISTANEGLRIWLNREALATQHLQGARWASVSIVKPAGLRAEQDKDQVEKLKEQENSEAGTPASKIVANILLWPSPPDEHHAALSSPLCRLLGLEGLVGNIIRVEASTYPAQRYSLKSMRLFPFAAETSVDKNELRFGGNTGRSRQVLVDKLRSAHGGEHGLLSGPLTDGMILPPAEPTGGGDPFAGGIVRFIRGRDDDEHGKSSWALGSEQQFDFEVRDEIPRPVPLMKLFPAFSHGLPPTEPDLMGVENTLKQCMSNLSLCSSVLLTGGVGAGKTAIAYTLSKRLRQTYLFNTTYFPCSKLVTDETRVSTIKENLTKQFMSASWCARLGGHSLVVLDDLDKICPLETELVTNDNERSRQVTELFCNIVRQYCSFDSRVTLLATAQSKDTLNNVLIGGHVFGEIVSLRAPGKETRRKILERLTAEHSGAKISNGLNGYRRSVSQSNSVSEDSWMDPSNPSSRPASSSSSALEGFRLSTNLDLLDIAGQTDGFMPADLIVLTSRARNEALSRTLKSDSTDSAIVLTKADFESALQNFTPSSLRNVTLTQSTTTFASVGGLKSTRSTLLETLLYPTKYAPIFAQAPLRLRSGLLLYGYPGCGKTLLASAVAGECGLNFISVKGPEILNKYIGASEKAVRDLFERAQAAKPCVLFFDEFDAIAPKRGHDSTGVTDRMVNQMLTQMDGAEGLEGVYVLAATSRPDLIDPALLRPGRLDKSLLCDMPAVEDREDILRAVSEKMVLTDEVEARLPEIAERTEGMSGADLQALMYNAHLEAIHDLLGDRGEKNKKQLSNGAKSGKHRPSKGKRGDKHDFMQFLYSAEEDAKARASPLSSTLDSKAVIAAKLDELKAAKRREKQVMKGRPGGDPSKNDRDSEAEAAKEKDEVVIAWVHIERSLATTRSSLSSSEQRRLGAIYEEFVVGRNGEMPSGQGGSEIGGRSSLM